MGMTHGVVFLHSELVEIAKGGDVLVGSQIFICPEFAATAYGLNITELVFPPWSWWSKTLGSRQCSSQAITLCSRQQSRQTSGNRCSCAPLQCISHELASVTVNGLRCYFGWFDVRRLFDQHACTSTGKFARAYTFVDLLLSALLTTCNRITPGQNLLWSQVPDSHPNCPSLSQACDR